MVLRRRLESMDYDGLNSLSVADDGAQIGYSHCS